MGKIFKNKLLSLAILGCILVPSFAHAFTPDIKSFAFWISNEWYRVAPSYKIYTGNPYDNNTKGAYVINTLNEGNRYNIVHHMVNSNGEWRSDGRTHYRDARTSYANWGQARYYYNLEMRIPAVYFGYTAWTTGTWAADNKYGY